MKALDLNGYALGSVAVALLAACGGSQPPIGALGATPQSRTVARHANRGASWMLPEAKGEKLMYISDGISGNVFIFSYPEGKQVGEITGLATPEGACIDRAQDVFIVVQGAGYINEYKHGGTKPIARLRDLHGERGAGLGCSVSPTTGDLAVVNQFGPPYSISFNGPPNVAIYKAAYDEPTAVSDPDLTAMYFCGYDDDGNLFVDGTSTYPFKTVLTELPKGGSAFKNVSLPVMIKDPGGVQWDGADLAVADRSGPSGTAVIYRFVIRHGKARTEVSSRRTIHKDAYWVCRSGSDDGKPRSTPPLTSPAKRPRPRRARIRLSSALRA